MKLTGIGFANFRSIGQEPVWLDLTKKVNILIGANNAGKSNVFRALQLIRKEKKDRASLAEIDRHQRDGRNNMVVHLRAEPTADDKTLFPLFKQIQIGVVNDGSENIVEPNLFHDMEFRHFSNIMRTYLSRHYSSQPRDEELIRPKKDVAKILADQLFPQLSAVHLIPDIRRIDASDKYEFDGKGIVKTLASWQIPKLGQESLVKKFDKLNALLQRLLRTPNVNLQVPPERDVIIVRRNGLRLPLASYGTGIHELIILAIAVFAHDDVIFCIEEPEIHLHPLLQKEFLRFLLEDTQNQYILSTHSHALMTPGIDCNVIHLWQEEGVTRSRTVESTEHSLDVLRDLGIDASDLLQARSVIWVEGPSDRIYLNRWLHLIAPELREGVDYSIMFYGGRLLSHLSLDRDAFPDPDDLISLLRINQYSAIMIDSDRGKAGDPIRATKERVRSECEKSGAPCWITEGREIENYLPVEVINVVYAEITGEPKPIKLGKFGRIETALKKAYGSSWRAKWSYDSAKVEMARKIAPRIEQEHISSSLKNMLNTIVGMIKKAG
jgi:predicted ATPase